MNVTYCRCGHVEDNDQHACPVTHERLRGNLSLAEEGLANYAQENGQFRKALEMIRDGSIPQAMSPALFAEFVLRGPVPQSAEHAVAPHK